MRRILELLLSLLVVVELVSLVLVVSLMLIHEVGSPPLQALPAGLLSIVTVLLQIGLPELLELGQLLSHLLAIAYQLPVTRQVVVRVWQIVVLVELREAHIKSASHHVCFGSEAMA